MREPEARLDITVTPTDDGKSWNLTDLLGRPMGRITEASTEQFTIHPDGHALETMAGIEHRPFASLDAALAAIEWHTRGVCRALLHKLWGGTIHSAFAGPSSYYILWLNKLMQQSRARRRSRGPGERRHRCQWRPPWRWR